MRRCASTGHRKPILSRLLVLGAVLLAACLVRPGYDGARAESTPEHGTPLADPPPVVLDRSLADAGVRATGLRYLSSPAMTEVTGAVYLPAGTPPPGGWPVIAYAHATTGVENRCAPSQAANMFGNLPTVTRLLQQGWAVVMSDYRGLGSPGGHPYMYAPSAADDVLDAVRAAQTTVPELGRSIVLYGVSQGGQATAKAAELAATYTPELTVRGVALNSPPLDITGLVDAIDHKSWSLTQTAVIAMVARGVQALHPDIRLDDYIHGDLLPWAQGPMPCTTETAYLETARHDPAWFSFTGDHARALMADYLDRSRLPRTKLPFPVFISRGTADTLATTAWQDDAVTRMCRAGDHLTQHLRPGDHIDPIDLGTTPEWVDSYVPGDVTPTVQWIRALLAGEPAPSTCTP
ncbi:alpha/beta fold hydrolase [Nocardia terpenica]|uniref:alpha/beta fold hydrolase n=1 Tax=Nocardia terpenica TaxID=455432 RepID=UPI002FE19A4B